MKPRLLDLFCGAGGAAMGYHRAGFDVVGVDIKPQPNYPFEFEQDDAENLAQLLWVYWPIQAIHASPPCQAYSTLAYRTGAEYPDLIDVMRTHLLEVALPYVIENVEGAPLRNPLRLCGSSFGLGVGGRELRRHRRFETNFPVMAPPCQHTKDVVGVYGTGGGGPMTRGFKAEGVEDARRALDTPWMTLAECAQAVPPAMTEHIGHYLMLEVQRRAKELIDA